MAGKLDKLDGQLPRDSGAALGKVIRPCQWRLRVRVKSATETWPSTNVTIQLKATGGTASSQSAVTRMQSRTSAEVVVQGSGPAQFELAAWAKDWQLVSPEKVTLDNTQDMEVVLTITALKTWVAIKLVDAAGKPVPGRPYQVKLPDRSLREGNLDSRGEARFDDIDPGKCEVCFPDLDKDAWEPVSTG